MYELLYLAPRRFFACRKRRLRLRRYGAEILEKVSQVFDRLGVPYFVNFGTLLGIVREGDFIAHDDDVDIGVLPGFNKHKELIEMLLDEGFVFKRGFEFNGGISELAFWYNDIAVDFFFYHLCDVADNRAGRMYYQEYSTGGLIPDASERVAAISARRIYCPIVNELHPCMFKGVQVLVPSNAEEYLDAVFGTNWKTPIKNWTTADSKLDLVPVEVPAYVIGLEVAHEVASRSR